MISNFFKIVEKDTTAVAPKEEKEEEEKIEVKVDPTHLFESDINLVDYPEELKNTAEAEFGDRNLKRSLRRSQEYLWINRVIPYEFTDQIAGEVFQ